MSNTKKKSAGAKASAKPNNKKTINKETKQNKDEWLESKINEVKLDGTSKEKKQSEANSDELMKKAAEQLEKLQVEVKE